MSGGSGDYGVPTGGVPRSDFVVNSLRTGEEKETTLSGIGSAWDRPIAPVPNAPVVVNSPDINEQIRKVMENIQVPKKHNHYFKDVSHLKTVDVYRVLELFKVTDQCIGHAVKKLLVAGGRGAGKDINKDIQEAIDSLVRWQDMRKEDADLK